MKPPPLVYVAVLDWGLGHATRSAALVEEFLQQNCRVALFGNGTSGHWLRQRFPFLPFHELPGPEIYYARNGRNFWWSMIRQVPALWRWYRSDRRVLASYPKPDLLVSDHRPGFLRSDVPSALMAHQWSLPFPSWLSFSQPLYHRLIRGFHTYWLPDVAEEQLSGALSQAPFETKYLGYLTALSLPPQHGMGPPLWLMSGPEPHRSLWEAEALPYMAARFPKLRWVRGTTKPSLHSVPAEWEVEDFAQPPLLSHWMAEAPWVWCRSGYSSLMDLRVFGKPAWLLPTPGQAEQEYLARLHQGRFGWKLGWPEMENLQKPSPVSTAGTSKLSQEIQRFINRL